MALSRFVPAFFCFSVNVRHQCKIGMETAQERHAYRLLNEYFVKLFNRSIMAWYLHLGSHLSFRHCQVCTVTNQSTAVRDLGTKRSLYWSKLSKKSWLTSSTFSLPKAFVCVSWKDAPKKLAWYTRIHFVGTRSKTPEERMRASWKDAPWNKILTG